MQHRYDRTKIALLRMALATVAVLLSAACTDEDTRDAAPTALAFDAYVASAPQATRSIGTQTAGDMTLAKLQEAGFGVFALHTTTNDGAEDVYQQDIFYNERVHTAAWTYDGPVKYWPNQFGRDAASTQTDRLTFLAYAPYTAMTDGADEGITGIVTYGDAMQVGIRYHLPAQPADAIDLMRATPVGPLTKQAVGSRVTMSFGHALARMRLSVNTSDDFDDANTRLTMERVTLTAIDGTAQGVLSLNDGSWTPEQTADVALTVAKADMPAAFQDAGDTREQPAGVVHTTGGTTLLTDGSGNPQYLYFIPQPNQTFELSTTYYTTTLLSAANPATGKDYIRIPNTVTSSITMGQDDIPQLEAGKEYAMNLVLGMSGMQFLVNAVDWGAGTGTSTSDTQVWDLSDSPVEFEYYGLQAFELADELCDLYADFIELGRSKFVVEFEPVTDEWSLQFHKCDNGGVISELFTSASDNWEETGGTVTLTYYMTAENKADYQSIAEQDGFGGYFVSITGAHLRLKKLTYFQ